MKPISFPDLADEIVAARQRGEELAEGITLDLDQGLAVAELVASRLGTAAGWKVGATSAAAQSFLGVGEPIRGRIYREAILASPAVFSPPSVRPCEVEPEIVLEAGNTGRPVRAWVGLEIVRPSRDDALELGVGFVVADNAAHVALILGTEIPLSALDRPEDLPVELFRNGESSGVGSAAAVLGDPRLSLEWLAGKGLVKPGDLVATGAMCRAAPLARGDAVRASFGSLGQVEACWPATHKL